MTQMDIGELCTNFVRSLSCFLFSSLGQNLFESIKNEPFSIPEDDGNDLTHTFFNPSREGWLLKLGKGDDSPSSSKFPSCLAPQIFSRNPPASLLSFPPFCCGGVRLTSAVETSHLLSPPSSCRLSLLKKIPLTPSHPYPVRAKLAPWVCMSSRRQHISSEHHLRSLGTICRESWEAMSVSACLELREGWVGWERQQNL